MRTYYGVILHPMGRNSWGGRWEALVNGRWLKADSLAGIKELIRREMGK